MDISSSSSDDIIFYQISKYILLNNINSASDLLTSHIKGHAETGDGRYIIPKSEYEHIIASCKQTSSILSQYREKIYKLRTRACVERFPASNSVTRCDFSQVLKDMFQHAKPLNKISRSASVVAFGSCFARNITRYLSRKGINAETMLQVEDFNNPLINAELISLSYVEHDKDVWTCDGDSALAEEINRLDSRYVFTNSHTKPTSQLEWTYARRFGILKRLMKQSSVCIFTLGTAYAMTIDGNIVLEPSVSIRNRSKLLPLDVILSSIHSLYASIRTLNQNCRIVFTLSPIPVYAAYGDIAEEQSVYEKDCISKSLCRTALHYFFEQSSDKDMYYYPSYEMVRWIAPFVRNLHIWEDPRHLALESIADPITEMFTELHFESS